MRFASSAQIEAAGTSRLKSTAFAAWRFCVAESRNAHFVADAFAASRIAKCKPLHPFFQAWQQQAEYTAAKLACKVSAEKHAARTLMRRVLMALQLEAKETR